MKDFSFDRVYRITLSLTPSEIIDKIIEELAWTNSLKVNSFDDDYCAEWITDTAKSLFDMSDYSGDAFADVDDAMDEWLDENMEELIRMAREALEAHEDDINGNSL